MTKQRQRLSSNIILTLFACVAGTVACALLPLDGPVDGDFQLFLIPWMDIIRERGLASVSGEFSAYSPPYIYLLNIASLIEPWVGTIAAVKLLNVPFIALLAWGVGEMVQQITGDDDRARIAVAVTLIVPSLHMNAFAFGQCDTIFSAFLVWSVLFVTRKRMMLAAAMFGLALSFKFQAAFLAPLFLSLVLSRQMRLRTALIAVVTYAAMMVPAIVAGRPWSEISGILLRQGILMQDLSLNAPNPWWFLRGIVDYGQGVRIGLLVGAVIATAITFCALRMKRMRATPLLIATLCAAIMPYVLPKMTSRYFFTADIFVIALAFVRPNLWPAAVLIQIGSTIAMLSYFSNLPTATWAFFPTTCGIGILLWWAATGTDEGAARLAPTTPVS